MKSSAQLVPLVLALSLVACATPDLRVRNDGGATDVQLAKKPAEPEVTVAVQPADPLPIIDLNQKILYQLMMSEFAAQRGALDSAYATEWSLANETRDPRIARRATEFGIALGQPMAAAQAAKLWLELNPNSVDANNAVLSVLIASNRFDEAEPLMRRKLANAFNKLEAFSQIHGTLSRSTNHGAALALMEKLALDYAWLPEVQLMLAQLAQSAGDKVKAVAAVDKAARLRPDWDIAVILLAQYLQPENPKEAEQALTEFLKRHPDSKEVRMAYARFLVNERRNADAGVQIQRLYQGAQNNPEIIYALGLLSYQAGNNIESEQYFQRFISVFQKQQADANANVNADTDADTDARAETATVNPSINTNSAYLFLSQIAEDRKDDDRALEWLDHIQDGSEYLSTRIHRAKILARQDKLDQAVKELADLPVAANRDRVQLTLAAAQLLHEAKRYQSAYNLLGQSLQKNADNPDLLYEYGMVALQLKKYEVMETSMRSLIRLRPTYPHGYNALGYTLADRNQRLPEALALIEKALSLAPDDASIIDSLGWVQYRLGHLPQAVEQLQRAYRIRPDADVGVHLGEVLWTSGHHAEAEQIWAEAKRKEPQNEALRQTLARFNINLNALNP